MEGEEEEEEEEKEEEGEEEGGEEEEEEEEEEEDVVVVVEVGRGSNERRQERTKCRNKCWLSRGQQSRGGQSRGLYLASPSCPFPRVGRLMLRDE